MKIQLYLFCFVSILLFCEKTLVESASVNRVVELNENNPQFLESVHGKKKFCTGPLDKRPYLLFSSASLEIKSNTSCTVFHSTDISLEEKESSIFSNIKSWYYTYLDKDLPCYHIEYVSLFELDCLEVKTEGELSVKYNFSYVDYTLVFSFVLGFALLYFANTLSKNDYFHYFSGISAGVLFSFLIIFFIMFRYLPKKSTFFFALASGSSIIMYYFRRLYNNAGYILGAYKIYVIGYVTIMGLISWIVCYYKGPIRNPRAIDILEYVLKGIAVCLIAFGSSHWEIPITLGIAYGSFKLMDFGKKHVSKLRFFDKIRYKYFPPQKKYITLEEYQVQGEEFTNQELTKLREYCRSPNCDSWKIITNLKTPDRFAKFVKTGEGVVTDEELMEYENYRMNSDLMDEDYDYDNSDEYDEKNDLGSSNIHNKTYL